MYQQFSLTIAFSVVLSVFNALTFTPALSALLLDKHVHRDRGFFKWRQPGHRRRHELLRAGGPPGAQGRARHADPVRGRSLGDLGGVRAVPSSFVPEEDEGYFIAIIQAPSGSSLEYTTNIAKQAEQIIMKQPEVLAVFSVAGFSFSGSAPNQGLIFARLKPFEERKREGSVASRAARSDPAGRTADGHHGCHRVRRLRRRRFRVSRSSADSPSRCWTDRAATSRTWPA